MRSNEKMYTIKKIETPRLIVRPLEIGDELPINKAVNNSLEILQRWGDWAKDSSIKATRDFVERGVLCRESNNGVGFPMVVVHKRDNKIIAASGYNVRSNPTDGLYEIGFWCDVDYQGNGYVTEYVNALTRYALCELSANIAVIRMDVDNLKGLAVAERLNFVNQGRVKFKKDAEPRDYYFTCEQEETLPPLDVSWQY